MYLNEFFSLYNGKRLDVDNAGSATNKFQCVDVIKAYCNKVFGVPVSSMSGYGDAWEYYDNFSKKTAITPYFNKIAYSSGMKIQAGDIVCWDKSINKSGAGHVAVATGSNSSSGFTSFDQNFPSGSPCGYVIHSYSKVKGVLRPKDYSKVVKQGNSQSYPQPVMWKNGKTKEKVYKENTLKNEIGFLSAGETAKCYSKAGDSYLVVYKIDGTADYKAGFVKYAGGVSYAPPESKTYQNGSTQEAVYADTGKRTKVGTLDKYEQCYCLGKINGMYLVLYYVTGSNVQKCGFVEYSGGIKD